MKKRLSLAVAALAAVTVFSSFTAVEETKTPVSVNTPVSFLRIHRQANDVVLSWKPVASDVLHSIVERSYDGEFFEPIAQANGGGAQKFVDQEVFPGFIHYRVTVVCASGTSESSPVQTIRIVRRK